MTKDQKVNTGDDIDRYIDCLKQHYDKKIVILVNNTNKSAKTRVGFKYQTCSNVKVNTYPVLHPEQQQNRFMSLITFRSDRK